MSSEMHYSERRECARQLYLNLDKEPKDVALAVGTDEATMRHWMNEGGWEGLRRTWHSSRPGQLEVYRDQASKLSSKIRNAEEQNGKELDLFVKYTSAARNLEEGPNVAEITEVFELFIQWLRRKDNALTRKLIVQLDAYVKQRYEAGY